ncbi:SGNH/GDSL hydrolase family protein [Ammonicoccus fulvus]|uniref:SGNH/GDSL hydrolase family protein n=1 Tax=Ammonicoccus fulvus TaxID=3138240 RepID=A0ABZ3FWU9_9ACTN
MGTALRKSRQQALDHSEHWNRPHEGTLTYVALGDSAGVGVGVDDPALGYVGLVAKRLAETTRKTVGIVNLSVSGAKARDVLDSQVPKLSELPPPDFVTCVIGGNDVAWRRRFSADDFAHDMKMIAARLPQGSVIGQVPNFLHWPYEGRAKKANRGISQAAALHGHLVAEIHTVTKSLSLGSYMSTFADDYFHPNDKGHALWADAIWGQLSRHLIG